MYRIVPSRKNEKKIPFSFHHIICNETLKAKIQKKGNSSFWLNISNDIVSLDLNEKKHEKAQ